MHCEGQHLQLQEHLETSSSLIYPHHTNLIVWVAKPKLAHIKEHESFNHPPTAA